MSIERKYRFKEGFTFDPTPREPESYSYRELPNDPRDAIKLFQEMADIQRRGGATFFRYTIISPEHPKEPYPYGLYVEGWDKEPNVQAPFNYPLTGGD